MQYLDEVEEIVISLAFLEWRITWDYLGDGVITNRVAAKEILKEHHIKKENLKILYMMKNIWIVGEREK